MDKFKQLPTARSSQQTGRSIGSFYDSLPGILDTAIQKPDRDDILERLHESTKSDRKIGWRMRTKYEEAACNDFGDMLNVGLDRGKGTGYSPRCQGANRRIVVNPTSELRGVPRYRDFYIGDDLSSPRQSYATYPSQEIGKRGIILEHCRRKGELFGPEAISAVGGHETARGRVTGSNQSWSSRYLDHYEDHMNISPVTWALNESESSANSSPRKLMTTLFENKLKHNSNTSECSGVSWTNKHRTESMLQKNVILSESGSNVVAKLESVLQSLESESSGKLGVAKDTAGKINLKIGGPFTGGGDLRGSKAKAPIRKVTTKKSKGASGNVRRPLRKKKKASIAKRKSVSKGRTVVVDRRHKGPKIEGFNFHIRGSKIEETTIPEERPKIRTVVLPYPRPKYKHTM